MGSKVRVLLVDDQPSVRRTLGHILQSYPNIEVVGEASDGDEAVASVGTLQPAIVVMDVKMTKMDGITAARLIKTQYPGENRLLNSWTLSSSATAPIRHEGQRPLIKSQPLSWRDKRSWIDFVISG